jgi:site-specific DNA-cytosine methylase
MGVKTLYLTDRKRSAREFQNHCHNGRFKCQWDLFRPHQTGPCLLHPGQTCSTAISVDLAIQGLPCQPFTCQRERSKAGPRTGPPSTHADFNTVMCAFFEYLDSPFPPKGFIVEEVPEFYMQKDMATGVTFCNAFVAAAEKRSYSVVVTKLLAETWGEVPRMRIFIFGLTDALGGRRAAEWISRHLEDGCFTNSQHALACDLIMSK